ARVAATALLAGKGGPIGAVTLGLALGKLLRSIEHGYRASQDLVHAQAAAAAAAELNQQLRAWRAAGIGPVPASGLGTTSTRRPPGTPQSGQDTERGWER
ncbi:MAG: hypothetical protein J2P19_01105, partial [Pseudonocardia sp.]|nr:hypothetical protein [Pseudonocardia sp.]